MTFFRYELDLAYNSHCLELELGERVECARIRVTTTINGENLEVTLADLTDKRCPASGGLPLHSASSSST
jgi:hypothetical protein